MVTNLLRGILFFSTVVSFSVQAAPSPGVSYLMDEPLSLFDYGIIRLNDALRHQSNSLIHRIKIEKMRVIGRAVYEWQKNRILLNLTTYLPAQPKDITYKKVCAETINTVKKSLSIGLSEDGAWKESIDNQRIESGYGLNNYFTHYFYSRESRPKNLPQELERITEISVEVINQKELEKFEGGYKKSSCKSPLLVDEIYYLGG